MAIRSFALVFAMALGAAGQVRNGPAVGTKIPAFEAPDQNGKVQTLDSIRGPKGAVLVFVRSADW
jgi:hypothetical protein